MLAIGLMSGTSLDGIDAVLCEVEGYGKTTKIKQRYFNTYPLSEELRDRIRIACKDQNSSTRLICSLNFEIGEAFAQAVASLLKECNLKGEDVAFVASHGQTVYHLPHGDAHEMNSTLQIGEPSLIAYRNGIQVISDFRVMDMAAGGEGAPLVPYSEEILYREEGKVVALQNIGGIGNVTLLNEEGIVAFDTGPGNMMIDEAMKYYFDKPYDENGDTAAKGKICEELYQMLINHPYLDMEPPKSTGREMFGEEFVHEIFKRFAHVAGEDIVATFTKFTAYCIADSYHRFLKELPYRVIVGGGGAHNAILMHHISEMLQECEVVTQEAMGFSSDAKEAIAFVVMGNETYHGKPSNVPSATGAKQCVVLGKITPKPW